MAKKQSCPRWGVEAGRGITKNGERFITITKDSAAPVEAYALTRKIARLLNQSCKRKK